MDLGLIALFRDCISHDTMLRITRTRQYSSNSSKLIEGWNNTTASCSVLPLGIVSVSEACMVVKWIILTKGSRSDPRNYRHSTANGNGEGFFPLWSYMEPELDMMIFVGTFQLMIPWFYKTTTPAVFVQQISSNHCKKKKEQTHEKIHCATVHKTSAKGKYVSQVHCLYNKWLSCVLSWICLNWKQNKTKQLVKGVHVG